MENNIDNKEKVYYIASTEFFSDTNEVDMDRFQMNSFLNDMISVDKKHTLPFSEITIDEIKRREYSAADVINMLQDKLAGIADNNDIDCQKVSVPLELEPIIEKSYADQTLSSYEICQGRSDIEFDSKYVLDDIVLLNVCDPEFYSEGDYQQLYDLNVSDETRKKLTTHCYAIISISEFINELEKNNLLTEDKKSEIIYAYNCMKDDPFEKGESVIANLFEKSLEKSNDMGSHKTR